MKGTRIPSTAFADAWIKSTAQKIRNSSYSFWIRPELRCWSVPDALQSSSLRRWTFAPGIAFSTSDAEPEISCGYSGLSWLPEVRRGLISVRR